MLSLIDALNNPTYSALSTKLAKDIATAANEDAQREIERLDAIVRTAQELVDDRFAIHP